MLSEIAELKWAIEEMKKKQTPIKIPVCSTFSVTSQSPTLPSVEEQNLQQPQDTKANNNNNNNNNKCDKKPESNISIPDTPIQVTIKRQDIDEICKELLSQVASDHSLTTNTEDKEEG
ncbi:hypothetical protein G9A89_021718 [Geosiphon pyriformis]|nr:hypothetical protein G9A89_021718 [Geosiphon pyriformis]